MILFFIIIIIHLFIEPPVINEELTSSDTIVDELSKVSLRCATIGYPMPSVTWRREDGKSLNLGQYGGKKIAGNLSIFFFSPSLSLHRYHQ